MNFGSQSFPAHDRSPAGPKRGAAILYGASTVSSKLLLTCDSRTARPGTDVVCVVFLVCDGRGIVVIIPIAINPEDGLSSCTFFDFVGIFGFQVHSVDPLELLDFL